MMFTAGAVVLVSDAIELVDVLFPWCVSGEAESGGEGRRAAVLLVGRTVVASFSVGSQDSLDADNSLGRLLDADRYDGKWSCITLWNRE